LLASARLPYRTCRLPEDSSLRVFMLFAVAGLDMESGSGIPVAVAHDGDLFGRNISTFGAAEMQVGDKKQRVMPGHDPPAPPHHGPNSALNPTTRPAPVLSQAVSFLALPEPAMDDDRQQNLPLLLVS
jgi:hypothetical protein